MDLSSPSLYQSVVLYKPSHQYCQSLIRYLLHSPFSWSLELAAHSSPWWYPPICLISWHKPYRALFVFISPTLKRLFDLLWGCRFGRRCNRWNGRWWSFIVRWEQVWGLRCLVGWSRQSVLALWSGGRWFSSWQPWKCSFAHPECDACLVLRLLWSAPKRQPVDLWWPRRLEVGNLQHLHFAFCV